MFSFSVGYILAVFVWSCAFLVIFVNSSVLPFVSVVTFLGGCLILIVTVSMSLKWLLILTDAGTVIDFVHCHAINHRSESKTMQLIKSRNCDIINYR